MDADIKTPLIHNLNQLVPAVIHAIESKWYLPAQILIYSSIDSAAWLAGDENANVGDRFCDFVDRWMLSKYPLPATSIDLYAARCGVLHTFTPHSKLSKKGKARRVVPATGPISPELQASVGTDAVVVSLTALFDSYRSGFADFLDYAPTDPVLFANVKAKLGGYGVHIAGDALNQYLAKRGIKQKMTPAAPTTAT